MKRFSALFLTCLCWFYQIAAIQPYSYHFPVTTTVNSILGATYTTLGLQYAIHQEHPKTQTLAYLNRDRLRSNLETFSTKINGIGKTFFEELFKTTLKREIQFNKGYRVFYHGQRRQFMLLQDLYNGLYQILHKKMLRDFILLRIPHKDFSHFTTASDFLHACVKDGTLKIYFDDDYTIRKHLLAVNPSLFGNTTYGSGECTMQFFIDSDNIGSFSIATLVEELFNHFDYQSHFLKYKRDIQELEDLLAAYEHAKTGLLLQIFVPEHLVNSVAYRCKPYGIPYYADEHFEQHPATHDLTTYKESYGDNYPGSSYGNFLSPQDKEIDAVQFRLLITNALLNPKSGIKFFRYCNQTENMEQYRAKLKKLLMNIATDIALNASLR